MRIDGLQYCLWSERIFHEMRQGDLDAVHVTICYHENFRETVAQIEQWHTYFERYSDLIMLGKTAADIAQAKQEEKTAIFFGLQNCSPIEDDIGLVDILYTLGVRFMQLTYNNQSLLASGCYESHDSGITRMGKQVIKEMNRVGMVIDMSHSGERSTLESIELSQKPIAITHANPSEWSAGLRSKSSSILAALAKNDGMLGFSLYAHHLNNKSNCQLSDFCQMVANTADAIGVQHLGVGSDLCQDQPDRVVEWMRNGRWSKDTDYGEGSASDIGFPKPVSWFKSNLDFDNIATGLKTVGFNKDEVNDIMGLNWLRFFQRAFG